MKPCLLSVTISTSRRSSQLIRNFLSTSTSTSSQLQLHLLLPASFDLIIDISKPHSALPNKKPSSSTGPVLSSNFQLWQESFHNHHGQNPKPQFLCMYLDLNGPFIQIPFQKQTCSDQEAHFWMFLTTLAVILI